MPFPLLTTGTHVVVGDGRKALILINEGTAQTPSLTVETVLEQADPPTHDIGSDRPGRVFASVGPRSAATDEPDWHQLAEDRFARDIIKGLVKLAERESLKRLIIVAPPRTLAELRKAMPDSFSKLVAAEIHKDLTKHPVTAITNILQTEEAAR